MFSTVSIFWPYASHTHGAPNEADKTVTEAAAYDPYKYGLIELCGEASELEELRKLAPACNCELRPGPDGDLWLGSDKFDDAMPEQAREQATEILITLNGLARMENYRHRNVVVGDEFLKKNRQLHHFGEGQSRRRGSRAQYFGPPGVAPFGPIVETNETRRWKRIVADPKLGEIVRAFADEMSWQKLRVAFERINALVGRGDNALVGEGYAQQSELTRFKANVEDPRHSGDDAVHGVHRGPLRASKMTKKEGFEFVIRLFNDYLQKNPA